MKAHSQKPHFVFQRNGRVHFNRRGRQFSRLLAAEVCTSAVVMLDTACSEVVWRVLATYSFGQFPLHFPSGASPCAITFQLDSTIFDGEMFIKQKAKSRSIVQGERLRIGEMTGPRTPPWPPHQQSRLVVHQLTFVLHKPKNQQMTYTWALASLTYIAVTYKVTSAMTCRISQGILEPLPCGNYKDSRSRFSQSETNEILGRGKVTW